MRQSSILNQKSPLHSPEKQCLRAIAPKPVMVVFTPSQQEGCQQSDTCEKSVGDSMEVKEEMAAVNDNGDTSEAKKGTNSTEVDKVPEENDASSGKKDNEDEIKALMLASTTIRSSKSRATNPMKKKTKQMRDMQSTLALLQPEIPEVREEKSYGFAQAYFLKVKERLEGTDVYHEFLHTMNEFGTSIVDVCDLYRKLTAVLNQHPDLSEEFLAFLLPEQAMKCGKLMEYLIITKMKDFFRKLEIFFAKQPQQMRKFYANLSALSSQPNVSVTDIRTALLPLLKGNSFLVDNFLELLPQDRPPESLMTEFEEMDFGDVDNKNLGEKELYETLVVPDQEDAYGGDRCACTCHDSRDDKFRDRSSHCLSCGTRFIHGKVFMQTGKVLRPAKVVFDTENSDDSINRLTAKNHSKGRNRRRGANHVNAACRKSRSPAKHTNSTTNENSGDNASKSSPPKHARTTKTKSPAANKNRVKTNSSKSASAKTLTYEPKEATSHKSAAKGQKLSSSARPSRLSCKKQVAPPSQPAVSSCNISNTLSSSTSLCITVPKVTHKNSNTLQSPIITDRPLVGTVYSSSTTGTLTDSSLTGSLHSPKNVILTIPTVNIDKSSAISPVTATSGSKEDIPPTLVHDESAILPPDIAAMDTTIKDFSTLSHVLQTDSIHRKNDSESSCHTLGKVVETAVSTVAINTTSQAVSSKQEPVTSMETYTETLKVSDTAGETLGNDNEDPAVNDNDSLVSVGVEDNHSDHLDNVQEPPVPMEEDAVDVYDTTSREPGLISTEVMDLVSDTKVATCDSTTNDVVMSENEDQVSGSESDNASLDVGQESIGLCLQPSNQTSQEEKCDSDATSGSWTREEDKIILQMFQLDCGVEQTFIRIGEQLPSRTLEEIQTRFQILMNLLQQMTGAKIEEETTSSGQ
ncbi:uncharacterized protein [Periplaneta americana]|uniref:uncharacterized protein isoform X2 n=1 Tax=Periplaneta americana TaxID=6978 RepID=UPI0037E8EC81